jgi:hypothetical protein
VGFLPAVPADQEALPNRRKGASLTTARDLAITVASIGFWRVYVIPISGCPVKVL